MQDPLISAKIIFMCIRYLDSQADMQTARCLLEEYKKRVMIAINQNDRLLFIVKWLANTHTILNFLKQFSIIGLSEKDDKKFNYASTLEVLDQCLRNLDLSFYWDELEQLGQWLEDVFLKFITERILEYSVPSFFCRFGENKIIDLKMKVLKCIELLKLCKVDDQLIQILLKRVFSSLNTLVIQYFMANTRGFCNKFGAINMR